MGLPANGVAAENQQRRLEGISGSSVGGVIEDAVSLARPALAVASAAVATGAAAGSGLAIAGSVVAGLGIVDWFRKLGSAKVNENLESLGQATEDALNRVERVLLDHGTSIDELKSRLNSQGFKDGMASASLQALRTAQSKRLKRLVLILANGVREDDLGQESLDDMMRAAAELTERDILELRQFVLRQSEILAEAEKSPMQWHNNVRAKAQSWAIEDDNAYRLRRTLNYLELSSSRARLAALGFISPIRPQGTSNSPAEGLYVLLPEGKKFYERLQEITVSQ
jgi:hypothetical protein